MMHRDMTIRIAGLFLVAVAMIATAGCEDKINLGLRNSEPKLVIEGCLGYLYGQTYFKVSRSTDFYEPNEVEMVSGAQVVITSDAGTADTLEEVLPSSPGVYEKKGFRGKDGLRFEATVTVDGRSYVACTSVPRGIDIKSIRTSYQPGDGIGPEAEKGYRLHVYFVDRKGIPDYARIRLTKNSVPITNFYFYDGKFSDGSSIDYDYFPDVFQIGDTVMVELISMNKETHDYFVTLADVVATEDGTNSFDATPTNPNTNWSGGALGYFGGFYFSRTRIIVK